MKTSLKVNLLPFHFFTAVHYHFGSRYSPFLICSPPLHKFSCISSPSFSSTFFFISSSSSFSAIHVGVEIRIKSKKRLGFLQPQIHLHLRMHGVHNLQAIVIFLVHELLPCLSILLVRVNMRFDTGIHVGDGRTYGQLRDDQNFSHL